MEISDRTFFLKMQTVLSILSEGLRIARGVLIAIAKRAGYSLTELQPVIGRDISVLSRMSANAETDKGRQILKKVIMRLEA